MYCYVMLCNVSVIHFLVVVSCANCHFLLCAVYIVYVYMCMVSVSSVPRIAQVFAIVLHKFKRELNIGDEDGI